MRFANLIERQIRSENIDESDRLNALWSGGGLYRLASFKTCCRTDIAVGSVGEHSVLRCQAQRGCATQKHTSAQRSLLDNRCKVVLRELVGSADLTRALFVVTMKCRFPQRLVRMRALCGPTRALFFVPLG